ncbi:MAG: beta-ketoacyl synthase chain length factor [Phycisphaerales bacterium]|nr:MAG: beta-ketoacyl synthase chain length factor [Phycisphaerales bacterium]
MTEMPLVISGIGLAGGFGLGREALVDRMNTGGGPNGMVSVKTESGERRLPAYQVDVSEVIRFSPRGALRRMNRYAKMAVLGASLALEDAGWDTTLKRNDVGLVIASGYGASESTFDFLDSMIVDGGSCPSPTLFSNSVHSSAASHLSIVLQSGGPCLTVSQFEMSPVSGLLTARQWLLEGRVEAVLFGAVDEICPVLSYCYDRFFGADACGAIEPFTWDKQTAVMGEGAAFLLLKPAGDASKSYGCIDSIRWTRSREEAISADCNLVLGADGHTCYGRFYRRLSKRAANRTSYAPLYGSLSGGQAFDVAIAAIAAAEGHGAERITSVKYDARGSCGIISCHFGSDPR